MLVNFGGLAPYQLSGMSSTIVTFVSVMLPLFLNLAVLKIVLPCMASKSDMPETRLIECFNVVSLLLPPPPPELLLELEAVVQLPALSVPAEHVSPEAQVLRPLHFPVSFVRQVLYVTLLMHTFMDLGRHLLAWKQNVGNSN